MTPTPGASDRRPDTVRLLRLWEAVRQTSHELVWEMDPDGVMRWINDAVVDVLGAPPEDIVGRTVFSLVHPEDRARIHRIFDDCVRRAAGWQAVRVRSLLPDGTVRWLETSGVAHVGPGGQLLGFTATTRRLDSDDAREASKSVVRGRIDDVLRNRRMTTVWQPIFSLDTGGVAGAEALSRFEVPGAPPAPPDRWFAYAFTVGLGVELELLAVEQALSAWRRLPEGVYVSVNVSPETVASGALPGVVAASGVPVGRVVLELTEHVSIRNYDAVEAGLAPLRRAGARLAVDDAGAGFASFRHILRLRPDVIKLDQSITSGIADNPAQRALATALVLFAMEVDSMSITAEGVETADDLDAVTSLGFDGAQGYHMARPSPLDDVDWSRTVPAGWRIQPAGR